MRVVHGDRWVIGQTDGRVVGRMLGTSACVIYRYGGVACTNVSGSRAVTGDCNAAVRTECQNRNTGQVSQFLVNQQWLTRSWKVPAHSPWLGLGLWRALQCSVGRHVRSHSCALDGAG